jgi:hypothetical protein
VAWEDAKQQQPLTAMMLFEQREQGQKERWKQQAQEWVAVLLGRLRHRSHRCWPV